MITRFKIFEGSSDEHYILYKVRFLVGQQHTTKKVFETNINRIMYYLEADYEWFEEPYGLYSNCDVDVIDFMKEIFVGKNVTFKSNDRPKRDPLVQGIVENVSVYKYQDEFFIQFKIGDNEYLTKFAYPISIENYDAKDKPLHKEIQLKKEARKYNL